MGMRMDSLSPKTIPPNIQAGRTWAHLQWIALLMLVQLFIVSDTCAHLNIHASACAHWNMRSELYEHCDIRKE